MTKELLWKPTESAVIRVAYKDRAAWWSFREAQTVPITFCQMLACHLCPQITWHLPLKAFPLVQLSPSFQVLDLSKGPTQGDQERPGGIWHGDPVWSSWSFSDQPNKTKPVQVPRGAYKASFASYKWLYELRGPYKACPLSPLLLDDCSYFQRQTGGVPPCLQPLLSQWEVSQPLSCQL